MTLSSLRELSSTTVYLLAALLSSTSLAHALEIARVGQWAPPSCGSVYAMAISGNYAYLITGAFLEVIDLSDPATPTVMANVTLPSAAQAIEIQGSFAYLLSDRLQVFDINNPGKPHLVGGTGSFSLAHDITVSGNYAYLAADGFQVIDISNPASLLLVGSTNVGGGARSVAVSGNYAYEGIGDRLQVFDISNRANPVAVATNNLNGPAISIEMSGSYVYLGVSQSLQVFDVSVPTSPVNVGSVSTSGFIRQIALSGSVAYIATDSGLEVVDISNPANPLWLTKRDTDFRKALGVSGTHVVSGGSGIQVFDISSPTNPVIVARLPSTASTLSAAHSGGYAYLADQYAGLEVVDASNPFNPVRVGGYFDLNKGSYPFDIAVSGSHAYMLDYSNGLQVFSITNPASPVLMGAWTTTNVMERLALFGNYAYVAQHSPLRAGMSVVDVSVPTNPVGVATYWVSNPPNSQVTHAGRAAASGNYIYLPYGGIEFANEFGNASIGNVESINVSNPTNPMYAGSVYAFDHAFFDVPQSLDVVISGNFVYDVYHRNPRAAPYTNELGGLAAIDISTPTNPILRSMFETHQNHSQVALSGNLAYMLGGSPDFRAIDISNPTNMTLVASTNTGGLRMDVSGHYAYFASGAQGLQIYCLDCPRLSAERAGNQILVKWPPGSVTYALESAQSIVNPQWQAVPGTPQLINGFYQLVIPATPPGAFLRLRGP